MRPLLLLLVLVASLLYAQENAPDSTARRADGVDTVIAYSADAIDFDLLTRTTILSGNARIEYKDMVLTAGQIQLAWDEQTMIAVPTFDTLYTDSTNTVIDTIVAVGQPQFKQGSEEFIGDEIAYNLKSKIGRVKGGRTVYQDGAYYGKQFKRISDDVLTVRRGEFTTCELDTPHFHFGADVLKIQVGERVFARPVYLYFADVPVLALPYGVFPIQKGRTSGFITPVFGESAAQGRFLRNIGYYWAMSDYMDLLGSVDYFETYGMLGRSKFRYAKRYQLNGNVDFEFDTQRHDNARNRRWQIAATHNQTIDPLTRITASGAYVSDQSYTEQFGSTNDRLNQTVRSNATLSKSWNNSPWSSSVNVGFTQNIKQETWSATLPAVRFTHKQGRLFPAPKAPRGIRFAVAPKEVREPWYRAFTWSYNVGYTNDLAHPLTFREEARRPDSLGYVGAPRDPQIIFGNDSTSTIQRDGAAHAGSFAATARLLRYINLNPSLDWRHVWTRRALHYVPADSIYDREDEYGFFTRTTFDVGSSASTKLYGLLREPLGIRAQFRHVMTPTVGFRYRPDFSDKEWGYFETTRLPDGREYTYDRFRTGEQSGLVGGTPVGLSEAMSISLGNLVQMKSGDAEAGKEKKFDLLSANFSTGIDFKRDSLKWNDISSSFRTAVPGRIIGPLQGMGFDVSTTHSLYQTENGHRVDRFFWERDGAQWYSPFDLQRASGSVDFMIGAERVADLLNFGGGGGELSEFDTTAAGGLPYNPNNILGDSRPEMPPLPQADKKKKKDEAFDTFFDMPLTMRFNVRHARDFVADSKTSTMGANFDAKLTPRWDASVSYYFDLDRRIAQNASVTLTRDLHCWEASLSWSPIGYSPGYYLHIGLKSPQLRDVKIERNRGGNLRGY